MDVLSVGAVTRYIKNLLDQDEALAAVLVRGEISNFKRHYSGHCYFTLKDQEATLRSVMFRGKANQLRFEPRDGMKVIAGGQISVFERDGQYQLYVEQLIPEGMGELSLAFAQLKDKLAAEGLFDEARKKNLPMLPKTIGLITSPTGAALRDMVTVSKRRFPGVQLLLFPVQVQGPEAPEQIARAIERLDRSGMAEVIIVGRGGGSIEELWAFNDERVVRAIAAADTPVISAVGHQTDFTLADFVADRRAATPSQAAEIAVPDVRELVRYIHAQRSVLRSGLAKMIENRRIRLERCRQSRVMLRPETLLADKRQAVDLAVSRMAQQMKTLVMKKQHSFRLAAEKLEALSPLATLARGFSITRKLSGAVVRRADEVRVGQRLEIVVHQGTIDVGVIRVEGAGDSVKKSGRSTSKPDQQCMF